MLLGQSIQYSNILYSKTNIWNSDYLSIFYLIFNTLGNIIDEIIVL